MAPTLMHPRDALVGTDIRLPVLSSCDHYAGSERFIQKALEHRRAECLAFDITCDAEDGAPVGQEQAQIEMIIDVLGSEPYRSEAVGVRTHPLGSAWCEKEIEAFVPALRERLAYITLPKVAGVAEIERVDKLLRAVEKKTGRTTPIPLHILVEQPSIFAELGAVAVHPRVRSLEFGIMDFISASAGVIPAGAMRSPEQFEHQLVVDAKVQIARAALIAGKVATHNVTLAARDEEQVEADAKMARRRFGFLRMWSIHPDQIRPILRGMAPDPVEVERAQRVIHAGADVNWGPTAVNGELFDRASYRYYWRVLEEAFASGVSMSDNTANRFFHPRPSRRKE